MAAVNQYSIEDPKHTRRPDIVVFVNGLPLGVIDLKNPADESADIWAAFNQLQTYKEEQRRQTCAQSRKRARRGLNCRVWGNEGTHVRIHAVSRWKNSGQLRFQGSLLVTCLRVMLGYPFYPHSPPLQAR